MALNVDDVFMGLRPRTAAVGRAFATGRPRRRIIRAKSSKPRWRMWSGTRSRQPIGARTCSKPRHRLIEDWAAYLAGETRGLAGPIDARALGDAG